MIMKCCLFRVIVFCVLLHSVLCFVARGEFGRAYQALRVAMMASGLLCVSRRHLDGLVGHDQHAEFGFG
jgi:hypothetical protein